MRSLLRCLTLFLLLVSCLAVTASATDLDVSLATDCFSNGQCVLQQGIPGLPASGSATFSGTTWSYQFLTANLSRGTTPCMGTLLVSALAGHSQ